MKTTDEIILMDKEFHFQEINRLLSEAANLNTLADKLGKMYTEKYCPYKVGDRLIIKATYSNEAYCKVALIHFHRHSNIKGMAYLTCEVWDKDFTKRLKRRNHISVRDENQIVKKLQDPVS